MSAIAKVLFENGILVSGSDLKESRNTKSLADMGIKIAIGHRQENIDGCGLVVISTAIHKTNPELLYAQEIGIPVIKRGEMLALLMKERRGIAVAGTHGKTTTTSMISLALESGGADPSFIIGGELNDIGSNAKSGQGEFLVAEADESDGSLLHLFPEIAVVTNIEADHLDYYSSFKDIEEIFQRFCGNLPEGGWLVACGDQPATLHLLNSFKGNKLSYGFGEHNDFRAEMVDSRSNTFKVSSQGSSKIEVTLKVPGRHNVLNALAAFAVCSLAEVDGMRAAQALGSFSGVKRRFQLKGVAGGVTVVDDYAHHPSEVDVTLRAAKDKGEWKRVVAVFQPHRYSRTKHLFREFGGSFESADVIVITDVYSAGEEPIPGVSGKLIVDSILGSDSGKKVYYLPKRSEIVEIVPSIIGKGDLLMTLGAGDVWMAGEEILEKLSSPSHKIEEAILV